MLQRYRRSFALVATVVGCLGVIASALGTYGVWFLGSRLGQANDRVFAAFDKGLMSAEEHLEEVQRRVEASKSAARRFADELRGRATTAATQRAAELDIDGRVENLSGRIQVADAWLAAATGHVHSLQQLLGVREVVLAPGGTALIEDVLAGLAAVRAALQQAAQAVDVIRDVATRNRDESRANRVARVEVALDRVLASVGPIDVDLGRTTSRLSDARADAQLLAARVSRLISLATIGGYVLMLWIAVGQLALWLWGWRGWRSQRQG